MAYEVAPLPYDYAALAPTIDEATMKLHHDKHHQTYVDTLNKALADNASLAAMSLDDLMTGISHAPPVVRNNGGGHWNHSKFWTWMAPAGHGGQPSDALSAGIQSAFGSLDELKAKFKAAGTGRFGSGWVWLTVDGGGSLAVTSTPNQDNPLMDVAETRGHPILGNDVWEHAYYLTYNNRRADYLDAWWNVVNWAEVSRGYETAKA